MTARLPLLLLPVLLLSACNGGGSADVAYPPLGLASMLPAAGSVAEAGTMVQIVFDREPDPATLTADAFVVADGLGPLPGAVSYDAAARRWSFAPTRPLPLGATVTAQLGASVRGTRGERLGSSMWSFRVRAGVAGAPIELAAGLGVAGEDRAFAAMRSDGSAVVAMRQRVWAVETGAATPLAALPTGNARGMHADDAGGLAVATLSGTGTGASVDVCRLDGAAWQVDPVVATGTAFVTDLQLLGNERGDLVVHLRTIETTSPTHATDELFGRLAASALPWGSVLQIVSGTSTLPPWRVAFDGLGRAGVMHRDGGVRVEVYDLASGTHEAFPLSPNPFATLYTLAGSRDGNLRALWNEPTNGNRELDSATWSTGEPAAPVGPSSACHWLASASGALCAWTGGDAYRSDWPGQWAAATLPSVPLAAAMSPRGEVVFLHFSLPDAWWLVRWRAGEDPDPPRLLATAASPFNGLRDAAVAVDAQGVVTAAVSVDANGPLLAVRVE